jgi:hypothetical protein
VQNKNLGSTEKIINTIPMSLRADKEKGEEMIIPQAMKLNTIYSNFMPHGYTYNTDIKWDSDNHKVLLEREGTITRQWLKSKLAEADFEDLMGKCTVNPSEAVTVIWGHVLNSFEEWGLGCLGENLG